MGSTSSNVTVKFEIHCGRIVLTATTETQALDQVLSNYLSRAGIELSMEKTKIIQVKSFVWELRDYGTSILKFS